MRQILTFLCLLLCTVTSSFSAEIAGDQTQVKDYLAILDLETVGLVNPSLSKPLSDCVRHEIVRSGRYKVLERVKMHEILKEQAFQMSGCVDTSCAVKAGQLLGVGKIIIGSLGLVGQTFYLSLSLVNVGTGEIEAVEEERCRCEEDRLIDSAKLAASKLVGGVTVSMEAPKPPSAEQYWGIKLPVPPDYEVVPLRDWPIDNAAAFLKGIHEGKINIGQQAKDVVDKAYGWNNNDDYDVAHYFLTRMNSGGVPSLDIPLHKSDAFLQYWKIDRQEQAQKGQAVPEKPGSSPSAAPPAEKIYRDLLTEMEFILVKGGCYEMGDTFGDGGPEEKPVHEVCVDDFYLGKYEVTVGQYRKFVDATSYWTDAERASDKHSWRNPPFPQDNHHPVVCISYGDALAFVDWLNKSTGKAFRLPTEAEWEYAARSGGKKYKYGWGVGAIAGNVADEANWISNPHSIYSIWDGYRDAYKYTAPVGSFHPNELGLFDMTGNVSECVADWYDAKYYSYSPRENPTGPETGGEGNRHIHRGSSFTGGRGDTRVSNRRPISAAGAIGFRLALSPGQ